MAMLHKCWLRSPGVETQKEVSVQWRWTNLAWSLAGVTFSSRNTREMSYSSKPTPQLFFLSVCKQKFRNNSDVPWCSVHTHTHAQSGMGVQTALQFQAIPAKEQKKKVCLLACKKTDAVVNRDFLLLLIFTLGNENVGAVMSVPVTTVWWLTIWISVVWFPASVCV